MKEAYTITLPSGFCVDFSRMFGSGRLTTEEIEAAAPRIQSAVRGVETIRREGRARQHLSKDGTPEPVFFPRLPFVKEGNPNTPQEMEALKAFGRRVRDAFDAVLFCGVGGSYLGGKVLYDCCESDYWPRRDEKDVRIFFVGNNLDTENMETVEKAVKGMAVHKRNRENKPLRVMLVPISKSGTTLESTTAFLYFYDVLAKEPDLISLDVTVVTDRTLKEGPMMRLAAEKGWEVFHIPVGIGGRFSVLSTPGLVVAAALGMDLDQLLLGAADMEKACQGDDLSGNPALLNAVLKYLAAARHGCTIEVFMPYAMRLKALGEWYVQLLAESLGKRKNREGKTVYYGRTPLVAIGTMDMHAQTQLHQDGIRDKVVQFVFINSRKGKLQVANPFPEIPVLSHYDGMDIGCGLEAAMEANEEALSSDERMNALYVLPELNEYYLGQLFYFLMLSIAYEGELADVDAYDQPGVEVYKKIMRKKLHID